MRKEVQKIQNVMVMRCPRKVNFNPKNDYPDMPYRIKYSNLKFVNIAHFFWSYFGGVNLAVMWWGEIVLVGDVNCEIEIARQNCCEFDILNLERIFR